MGVARSRISPIDAGLANLGVVAVMWSFAMGGADA